MHLHAPFTYGLLAVLLHVVHGCTSPTFKYLPPGDHLLTSQPGHLTAPNLAHLIKPISVGQDVRKQCAPSLVTSYTIQHALIMYYNIAQYVIRLLHLLAWVCVRQW